MSVNAMASLDDMYNIMNGPADPSLLARPKASTGPTPLSGDVLRAYDGFRAGLEAAAGVELPAPSGVSFSSGIKFCRFKVVNQ